MSATAISAPAFICAPCTSPDVIARTSRLAPSNVMGVKRIVSARKPMVWALAMFDAITRWRIIEAFMPETAV